MMTMPPSTMKKTEDQGDEDASEEQQDKKLLRFVSLSTHKHSRIMMSARRASNK